MQAKQSALMETSELLARLGEPHLKVLDASYHVPPSPRQAKAEYEQGHIPGAAFFDIDAIADPQTSLPHMVPSAVEFGQHMERLGITSADTVVVYDSQGIFSAPRAWWMFRYFGHDAVYVLNGGLPKWLAENLPIETGLLPGQEVSQNSVKRQGADSGFKAQVNPQLIYSLAEVQDATQQANTVPIVDMRPAGRFAGLEAEPRAGLKRGHIPGSINIPWSAWLNPDKTLLSLAELESKCRQVGLDWRSPAVMTCGSGVTACVGALALYELGNSKVPVYDGAWAEWGAIADLPVACSSP